MDSLLEPEQHVLSTLERDGSRRWLKPRLSPGRYLRWRRLVAYLLIATYTLLPFVKVGGKPLVLLDVAARRFTLFGFTFLPTDTLLLALFMVGVLLGFFLLTALLGRIWCGWACPQTVYLEFVYRPIERLFDGTRGRGGAPRTEPSGLAKTAKFVIYLLISFLLANTFLAYFVGVDTLAVWMTRSPISHPLSFSVMAVLTVAMMIDFSYFREQMCIITCPYGRLQSVLLDDESLIVSYDVQRGEPRGKQTAASRGKARGLPVVSELGDCVDCKLCVRTCPTGIDIRDGLQMECVNCTQCMDACDAVMTKLGRKPGLIRYASQVTNRGQRKRLLRARTMIYPAILAVVAAAFVVVLLGKTTFTAVLLRNTGQPYTMAEDGRVRNVLRIKLTSRVDETQRFSVEVVEPDGVELAPVRETMQLAPRETGIFPISVLTEPALLIGARGQLDLTLRVIEEDGDAITVEATLLGPDQLSPADRAAAGKAPATAPTEATPSPSADPAPASEPAREAPSSESAS